MKIPSAPEHWKQYIDGYYVSDQGRVKHIFKNGRTSYLTPVKRTKSMRVKIHSSNVTLNKLIWQTFKGEIPNGYTVLNRNGYHTIHDLQSLVLVKENDVKGGHKGKKVIDLRTGIVYPSARYAESKLKVSHNWICAICRGDKQSEKYKFEYYDEDKEYERMRRIKK